MDGRDIISDLLQDFRFHLVDLSVSPLDGEFINKHSWSGYSYISAPALSMDVHKVDVGNMEFPVEVIKGVTVERITLKKGVSWFDSDFWYWVVRCVTGKFPIKEFNLTSGLSPTHRKNFLLMQFGQVGDNMHIPPLGYVNINISGQGVADKLGIARCWILMNCIPVKYISSSDFDASSGKISITSLDLSVEMFSEVIFPLARGDVKSMIVSALRSLDLILT